LRFFPLLFFQGKVLYLVYFNLKDTCDDIDNIH